MARNLGNGFPEEGMKMSKTWPIPFSVADNARLGANSHVQEHTRAQSRRVHAASIRGYSFVSHACLLNYVVQL